MDFDIYPQTRLDKAAGICLLGCLATGFAHKGLTTTIESMYEGHRIDRHALITSYSLPVGRKRNIGGVRTRRSPEEVAERLETKAKFETDLLKRIKSYPARLRRLTLATIGIKYSFIALYCVGLTSGLLSLVYRGLKSMGVYDTPPQK